MGVVAALASGGGGDVVLMTREPQVGGEVADASGGMGSMVVVVAFRTATLASSELRAVVIGRRRWSNESVMVEVVSV